MTQLYQGDICIIDKSLLLQEGDIIPGYKYIKEIGKGGMGVVYLVEERKTNKQLALKTIKTDQELSVLSKDRFIREASVQEQLNHKNIAQIYSHGEYNGMLYILMEYYRYGTITNYYSSIKKNKNRYALMKDILIQILEGLDYLHNVNIHVDLKDGTTKQFKGIIHRDIKPENIFIDYDSQGQVIVKIADFGLAKAYEAAGLSGMSLTGQGFGTVVYMPRMQLIDTKHSKVEVDIWASVASIYTLLTSCYVKPFTKDKNPYIVCIQENPIPIKKRDLFFPLSFAKIIDKALYDNYEQLYYQNAKDLIKDLKQIKV